MLRDLLVNTNQILFPFLLASFTAFGQVKEEAFPVLELGGKMYTNATVRAIDASHGVLTSAGVMAGIKLQDLPEPSRSRFVDPAAVAARDAKLRARGEEQYIEARRQRAAFIEKCHPLRVIGGVLYDLSGIFNRSVRGEPSPVQCVSGNVFQVTKDGVLVRRTGALVLCFVENWEGQSEAIDQSAICAYAINVGRYQYTSISGAQTTIPKYDCGRVFDPSKDHFQQKTVMTKDGPRVIPVSELDL